MSPDVTAAASFALATLAALLAMPGAIALARRTGSYDHPVGYKRHAGATPNLGGVAMFSAFALAAITLSGGAARYAVILASAALMCAIGAIDDRSGLPPLPRLFAEVCVGVALYEANLGWLIDGLGGWNLVLTAVWVTGIVTAFNLMDNLDGASGMLGVVCAAGIGTIALIHGNTAVSGLAFGLSGACAGFLRYNFASPSRIFLGDGGSMPLGFLIAALAMAALRGGNADGLLLGGMLCALPILDTTLVSASRTRRRVPVTTAGRDHLTHRLLMRLHSPRAVAYALGLAQAAVCGLAIAVLQIGGASVPALAGALIATGVVAIEVLDAPAWHPPEISLGTEGPGAISAAVAERAEEV